MNPDDLEVVRRMDEAVDRAFDQLREHRGLTRAMYHLSELGDFSLLWHLIGAARGLRSDRHADEAFRLSATLGVESLLVNGALKALFRRERPDHDGDRPHRLRQPRTSSFPSGHASAAFCAAVVLSERSRARPVWFGLATLVAASRVHVKIHHASDVIAGAVIGAVIGKAATRIWRLDP